MNAESIERFSTPRHRHSKTEPEAIILAAQNGLEPQAIARLLEQAGLSTDTRNENDLTQFRPRTTLQVSGELRDAQRQLHDQPGAHLLLIYRDPVEQIAESIGAKVDPEAAVAQWREQAAEMLSAYRRARRRITLLELSAAQADPNAAVQVLNEHLGLALTPPAETAPAQSDPERDSVHILIAERALHQDTRARHAAAELQASALPLTGTGGALHIDLSSTVHAYREKSEVPLEQVNGLTEEKELLLSQLEQVQEQLKSQTSRNKELKARLQDAEKQNSRLTDENRELKTRVEAERDKLAQLEDLKEENDLLLAQLHQVQEELESYFLENQDLRRKQQQAEKENTELTRQARQASNMLADVHKSWSWKLTAPIRAVLGIFIRK